MNLLGAVNRLGSLVSEPATAPVEYVSGVASFGRSTLAESERIIRENPELARAMGVEVAS